MERRIATLIRRYRELITCGKPPRLKAKHSHWRKRLFAVMLAQTVFYALPSHAAPTGTLVHPIENSSYNSNLFLFFKVSDTVALNSVGVSFGDTGNSLIFCNGNCGTNYRGVKNGVNPVNFGLNPGTNVIHLWANNPDNVIDSASFNWQPKQITGIQVIRNTLGEFTLNWSPTTGIQRYNLYASTERGVSPENVNSIANGQAFRSISGTSQVVTGYADETAVFARITGVDYSGESAFSAEIAIPAFSNALPVAENDQFTGNEDSTLSGNVMNNDFDPDNQGDNPSAQELVATLVENAKHGQVTLSDTGQFTYVPNSNFNGTDSFVYEIADPLNGIDSATVTLIIRPVNDLPVAQNDSFSLNEDSSLTVNASGLLSNDSDVDGNTLSVNPVAKVAPQSGTLQLGTDGSFTYTPNANFSGTDSFMYAISDGVSQQQPSATVSLTVSPINDLPVANNDVFEIDEDTQLQSNVLNNDSDADVVNGDKAAELTVALLSSTSNGEVNLSSNGEFTYTPNLDFVGSDAFSYRITDSAGETADANVSITINAVADAPKAEPDSYTLDEDSVLQVTAENGLLANDSDPDPGSTLKVSKLITLPEHGTVEFNQDGSFTYTPESNQNGSDEFTYQVEDNQGNSSNGQVSLSINPIPDAPEVEDDVAEAIFGEATEINVLENDNNLDNDNSALVIVSATALHGTVSINEGRTLTYTAQENFEGTDTVTYAIKDGLSDSGLTSTGKVTITVLSPNDPPIANDDNITIDEDKKATIPVLQNDSDPDNDQLTIIEATADTGTVIIIPSEQVLQYTPAPDFFGEAIIKYTIEDSRQQSASAIVTVTVVAVNDAPIAEDDKVTTPEDIQITIDALANDSDADEDTLTIISILANNGDAIKGDNETIIFTPANNFNGDATVKYTVSDNNGGLDDAIVTITVTPVNDFPIAQDDTATTPAGTTVTILVLDNDSDPDGDTLEVFSASTNTGSVSINAGTSLNYTPPAGFSGTATISYSIRDNKGGSATAQVIVTAGDQNPTATNDSYILLSDGVQVSIAAKQGVLENDSDPEGNTLTATIATSPSHASAFTLNTDGSFDYLHDGTNNLTDSFTYTVSDGAKTATGSVSINIHMSNTPPELCIPPVTHATVGVQYSYPVYATDWNEDTLTYSATGLPSWLTINSSSGLISGTPGTSDSSASNIQVTVSDGKDSDSINFAVQLQDEFGISNALQLDLGGNDRIEDMALDNYGRIVAVGQSNNDVFVIRLLPNGDFDTSFNGSGKNFIDFGSTDHGYAVAIDKENNILIAAQTTDSVNGDTEIGIAKLLSSGSLDTSFGGGDGLVEIDVNPGINSADYVSELVIHDNTDITVLGYYHNGTDHDVVLLQTLADGTLDSNFGSGGKLIYSSANDQFAHAIVKDDENRLYIAGSHHNGTDNDLLLGRIDLDSNNDGSEIGTWDTGFDSDGIYTYDGGSTEIAYAINFDSNGNLVVAGDHANQFGTYSFTTTPALNTSGFNSAQGYLVHDITSTSNEKVTDIIRDEQGNLYAFGKADNDIGIIKILSNGTLDSSFAGSGELIVTVNGASDTKVSAMLNGNGQLMYADTDTSNTEVNIFQKINIADPGFTSCGDARVVRNNTASITNDTIVDVVEGAPSEFYAVGYGVPNGVSYEDVLIFKLSSNTGSISEFADTGYLRHNAGASFVVKAVNTTSAQDLLVTGLYNDSDLRVLKFNISGNLHSPFSSDGIQDDFNGVQTATAFATSIDNSNNLLIATTTADATPVVRLIKIDDSGAMVTGFGTSGITDYVGATGIDMTMSADGSIYVLAQDYGSTDQLILKFTAAGTLDSSFATSGVMTLANITLKSVTALSDNSIVVLMDNSGGWIQKFTSTGALDTNFANGGTYNLTTYTVPTSAKIKSDASNNIWVHLQDASTIPYIIKMDSTGILKKDYLNAGQGRLSNDVINWTNMKGFTFEEGGKLVVFGESNNDFALAHMDSNGTIINGESNLRFDFGFGDHGYDIELDHYSRILVSGNSFDSVNNDVDQAIARFTHDGSADTSYDGGEGIHIIDDAIVSRFTTLDINVQSKTIVAGIVDDDISAGRLQPNSTTLDGSFNSSSYVVNATANTNNVSGQFVDDMGNIWLVGSENNKGNVAVIDRSGTLAGSFASSPGEVNYELAFLNDSKLMSITRLPDGKLLAVGEIFGGTQYDAFMVKFDPTGVLDTSFDSDGILYYGQGDSIDNGFYDVALDAEGNIIVVGESNNQMIAKRYDINGTYINAASFSSTNYSSATAVQVDSFGAIFIAGQSDKGFELYRFKSDWTQLNHFPSYDLAESYKVRDIAIDSIGNLYMTGSAQIDQEWDIFVLKYASAVGFY
ncbi:tandem-95 repeat protein [Paraneptunicella aestuarii]|uniref:Ig-like domain-containing protein n=1 Tax=Paraneptunicella aestuarii TaxID=2831148 RepID=UPI001E389DB7|nr:Ig-like domain-containing protein [Paraneptunicella aestuarii]UAA39872.1 tandem-95 repeat protein [Paraneptunicella aestuarii]